MLFDPYHLTPTASINRVRFIEALDLPKDWYGKTAYDLLSRKAVTECVVSAFPELATSNDPLPEFERRYLLTQEPVALDVAHNLAQRLICLLTILKHGEVANREARPEWNESYWAHWAAIKHVILGGGLVSGLLGQAIVQYARPLLNDLYSLDVASQAARLPLIGAARRLPANERSALVLDFGQTAIKRAYAYYKVETLIALDVLPSVPASEFGDEKVLLGIMLNVIASSWQADLSTHIVASIANYVRNGKLAADTAYGQLGSLTDNINHLVSAEVSQKVGRTLTITFIHDGTAAATAYAGLREHAAVITMGTALGVGFPPSGDGLRPIESTLIAD